MAPQRRRRAALSRHSRASTAASLAHISVTNSPAGHEAAKQLDQLIREWPDLRNIMKALQPAYVFVARYLRTIPRSSDDSHYRTDAYVNGLFVVDVNAVRTGRHPQID